MGTRSVQTLPPQAISSDRTAPIRVPASLQATGPKSLRDRIAHLGSPRNPQQSITATISMGYNPPAAEDPDSPVRACNFLVMLAMYI
jgi:hypothetical protein